MHVYAHVCTCMQMYADACTCMHMHAHACACGGSPLQTCSLPPITFENILSPSFGFNILRLPGLLPSVPWPPPALHENVHDHTRSYTTYHQASPGMTSQHVHYFSALAWPLAVRWRLKVAESSIVVPSIPELWPRMATGGEGAHGCTWRGGAYRTNMANIFEYGWNTWRYTIHGELNHDKPWLSTYS